MLLESESVALLKSSPRRRPVPAATVKFPPVRREVVSEPANRTETPKSPAAHGLKHVALLVETTGAYGRGLLQGIAKYNREHGGWSTYFRPHALNDAAPGWLRTWKGDGMIVRVETPEQYEAIRRCGAPAVNLRGTIASELPLPYVTMDNRQVAQLALQHFKDRGIRHFAACGRGGTKNPALGERIDAFRELVEADGTVCHIFPPLGARKHAVAWEQEQDQLAEWVRSLPKPVGIFGCNDERGLQVLDACRRVGVVVPDDVAVLGVDNDPAICDLTIPPLSSVDPNAEKIGYEAAALLDRMMRGETPPKQPIKLAPRAVVTRRSSDIVASEDQEVGRALGYIREHACKRLQVVDVLSHMAMSRASLQQRMKQVVGRTVHQEIQRVRLAKVKDLLAMSELTIKQVARESGFASVQYMTRVFRAVTGETPARYRISRAK
jgi:LacI family transcriptional regulator